MNSKSVLVIKVLSAPAQKLRYPTTAPGVSESRFHPRWAALAVHLLTTFERYLIDMSKRRLAISALVASFALILTG
ncbi:MAG: hypothetical protein ACKO3D_00825, partial [Actinomycetota bacterium]